MGNNIPFMNVITYNSETGQSRGHGIMFETEPQMLRFKNKIGCQPNVDTFECHDKSIKVHDSNYLSNLLYECRYDNSSRL
jgi:hypothetical protein